jgi:hypothetical protein
MRVGLRQSVRRKASNAAVYGGPYSAYVAEQSASQIVHSAHGALSCLTTFFFIHLFLRDAQQKQAYTQPISKLGRSPMSVSRPQKIPDNFNADSLARELSLRIAGRPADGRLAATPALGTVIWIDAGSEVIAHLDSIQTRLLKGTLLVSIDLETDQTGRSPLIVALHLSADPNDPAGLVATTDEYPRGDGQLASRWGRPLQAAVWASLLSLAQDHAAQRSGAPQAITITEAGLTMQAGPPLSFIPRPIIDPGGSNNGQTCDRDAEERDEDKRHEDRDKTSSPVKGHHERPRTRR